MSLWIKRIIHISATMDLIHSINPDLDFCGYRFWDYCEHQISEAFDSEIAARNSLVNGKITWRKIKAFRREDGASNVSRMSNHATVPRTSSKKGD